MNKINCDHYRSCLHFYTTLDPPQKLICPDGCDKYRETKTQVINLEKKYKFKKAVAIKYMNENNCGWSDWLKYWKSTGQLKLNAFK